jgi:Leucine-rich repeat (LRR) protein
MTLTKNLLTIPIILFFFALISCNSCSSISQVTGTSIGLSSTENQTLIGIDGEQGASDPGPNIIIGGHETDIRTSEINKLTYWAISIRPHDPSYSISLEGIEQLRFIENLTISGTDFSEIDFSPLRQLPYLKHLKISDPIGQLYLTQTGREVPDIASRLSHIPDLSGLDNLKSLEFNTYAFTTMDGIEACPLLESLIFFDNVYPLTDIKAISQIKNLKELILHATDSDITIASLAGLSNLETLRIQHCNSIDFEGIEGFAQLRILRVEDGGLILHNVDRIGELTNLVELEMPIQNSVDSLDFLSGLTKLEFLDLEGNYTKHIYSDSKQHIRKQVDVTPLRNLSNLRVLVMQGFVVENFHVLDELPFLWHVNVDYTSFFPSENNKLRRNIVEYEGGQTGQK